MKSKEEILAAALKLLDKERKKAARFMEKQRAWYEKEKKRLLKKYGKK